MTSPHALLIATRNQGKRREYEMMLAAALPDHWTFEDLSSLPEPIPDVVEDRDTFVGNAIKKAVESSQTSGRCVLAEDSGLVVDALDGAPGVYSARFAGLQKDDAANNALLVERLSGVPLEERTARYVALTCLAMPDSAAGRDLLSHLGCEDADELPVGEPGVEGELGRVDGVAVVWFRGTVEGLIVDEPRGDGGFGYDPHFLLPHLEHTMAELSAEHKNSLSHRASALDALARAIRSTRSSKT